MKIFEKDDIYLEIDNLAFDVNRYSSIVSMFKKMPFYRTADFVFPSFSEGLVVKAVGREGINYKIVFGDVSIEFVAGVDPKEIFLPGDKIESVTLEVVVYREGSFIGSMRVAFVTYILFAYVCCQLLVEDNAHLRENRLSRYLFENDIYPMGFEDFFGSLYGIKRLTDWSLDTYRDIIIKLISCMKRPDSVNTLKELISSVLYKVFAEDGKNVWVWGLGFSRIDNGNSWGLEKL